MQPVRLAVHVIVEDVDGAGDRAEAQHSRRDAQDRLRRHRRGREEQRRRDEGVLHPLMGPQQPEEGGHAERPARFGRLFILSRASRFG